MHFIDGLLEGLEVRGDSYDVFVKRRDLELVILKITMDSLFTRFWINGFVDLSYVELVSNLDHTLIPAQQFLLKFLPQVLNRLLNPRLYLVFVGLHVGQ